MNLTVNPYGNFSNSNRVNFQADLNLNKIKFGRQAKCWPKRCWSEEHWNQVNDIFKDLTKDCPDYTFILEQIGNSFIEFRCACGESLSLIPGTLKLAAPQDKFVAMSAEEKAKVLAKLFRMKKLNDDLEIIKDEYLLEQFYPPYQRVHILDPMSLFQYANKSKK